MPDSVFYSFPPDNTIRPPEFPPRPDLFDEVEWGPFLTREDAKLAHRLWDLPNTVLGNAIIADGPFPRPDNETEAKAQDMHVLANNVYEHLMQSHLRPPSQDDWEQKWRDTMLHDKTWSIQTIFSPIQELQGQDPDEHPVLIEGHDVLSAPWWTVVLLREELRNRGLSDSGRSADLRRRLYDNEREMRGYSLLPRSDLSHLGVNRNDNFAFRLSEIDVLKPLDMYTWAIVLSPYNPAYWLSRAYCHYQQAFFDLAIGDAYRAQLLCAVLVDPRERNRQPGLYPRIWHAIEQHLLAWPRNALKRLMPEVSRLRGPNGINYFVPTLRKALHNIISLSLSALGCWKDYKTMERYLKERVIMPYRDLSLFERRQRVLHDMSTTYMERRNEERLFFHEKCAGNVNGAKEYPYEAEDKDRTAGFPLDLMNRNLFKNFPKCEVRGDPDDNSLSVITTEDIEKNTLIFAEEPSARGHLTVARLPTDGTLCEAQEIRCDNCRKHISSQVKWRQWNQVRENKDGTHEACPCIQGDVPLYFCAENEHQGPTCLEIARELYHHRACGKNWEWLHNAMRPGTVSWNTFKHFGVNEPGASYFSHTNEVHGTTLSLLLREVFDMTLIKRDTTGDVNLMAHEIDELFMLEDPKSWSDSWFPFTLAGNIQVPFDILLQLGVDIFRDLTFDTWVIQIVLRKLLLNAVPWDRKWRGKVEHVEEDKTPPRTKIQASMIEQRQTFEPFDPSFQSLYLFSGFSLFNHACRGGHNAQWGYDQTVPNRVLVWATKDISKSTEIRIPYKYKPMSCGAALRILGKSCQCSMCQDGHVVNGSSSEDDDDDNYEGYSDHNGDDHNGENHNEEDNGICNGNGDDTEEDDDSDNSTNSGSETSPPGVDSTSNIAQLKFEGMSSSTQPQPHQLLSNPYVRAQKSAPRPPQQPQFENPTLNLNPWFEDGDRGDGSGSTMATEGMTDCEFERAQTRNREAEGGHIVHGSAEKRKRDSGTAENNLRHLKKRWNGSPHPFYA